MHAIQACLFLYGRIIKDCVQINRKTKTSQKQLPHKINIAYGDELIRFLYASLFPI